MNNSIIIINIFLISFIFKTYIIYQYKIKSSNEVCYLSQQEDHKKDNRLKISQAYMQLKIKRAGMVKHIY